MSELIQYLITGLGVGCAFALVDRLEGGREAVTQKGYGLSTLFTRSDFLP